MMRTTLYVANLASHADPRVLTGSFVRHGTVVQAQVFEAADMIHRRGGFGIVRMASHEEAEAAIAALAGAEALGGTLAVRWASPHELTSAESPRMFGTMNTMNHGEDAS
jgi:transformer-2 protein